MDMEEQRTGTSMEDVDMMDAKFELTPEYHGLEESKN
jgi:hypothetical protein